MTFNFNPDSPGAAYRYYSIVGYIWVVPRTALRSVGVDKWTKKPAHVNYPTNNYYMPIKCYPTLKGLCKRDLEKAPTEFIVYQLENGQLLAADQEAIAKATTANHNANYADCLDHKVSDLFLMTELPPGTVNCYPDQYDYEREFG